MPPPASARTVTPPTTARRPRRLTTRRACQGRGCVSIVSAMLGKSRRRRSSIVVIVGPTPSSGGRVPARATTSPCPADMRERLRSQPRTASPHTAVRPQLADDPKELSERQASRATNRHEPSGADRTSRAARAADAEPRKCIGSTRLSACTPSAAQPGPTGDADRRMRPARSPHQGQPSLLSVRRSERAAATATHTARRSPLVDQQLRLTRPAQVSQPKGARLVAEVPSRNEKLSAERPLLAQSAKRPGALAPRTSDLRET